MLKTRTAVVVTVMIMGNAAVSLQAANLRDLHTDRLPAQAKSVQNRIANLLQQRGLEPRAANEKTSKLFNAPEHADVELSHLYKQLGTGFDTAAVEQALGKRALFGKPVNLASAESLTALLHEATGKAPDESLLKILRETADLNRAFRDA